MRNIITVNDVKILNCLKKSKQPLRKSGIHYEAEISETKSNKRVDHLYKLKLIDKKDKKFLINPDGIKLIKLLSK